MKRDTRQSVKLTEANSREYSKLAKSSAVKTSIAAIANAVLENGLDWAKRITPTKR